MASLLNLTAEEHLVFRQYHQAMSIAFNIEREGLSIIPGVVYKQEINTVKRRKAF